MMLNQQGTSRAVSPRPHRLVRQCPAVPPPSHNYRNRATQNVIPRSLQGTFVFEFILPLSIHGVFYRRGYGVSIGAEEKGDEKGVADERDVKKS